MPLIDTPPRRQTASSKQRQMRRLALLGDFLAPAQQRAPVTDQRRRATEWRLSRKTERTICIAASPTTSACGRR